MNCLHRTLRPRYLCSLNMMFTDKEVHFDTGGWDGEANEIALKLEAKWCIRSFDLIPDAIAVRSDDGGRRIGWVADRSDRSAIVEAVTAAERLPFGTPARIANLYFAAMWSRNVGLADRFFDELRQYCGTRGLPSDLSRTGEVRYLRRLLPGT